MPKLVETGRADAAGISILERFGLTAAAGPTRGGFGWLDAPRDTVPERPKADGPIDQNPGPGGDTVPGDSSTTFTLDIGDSVEGYINTGGDRDWYAVQLEAGQFYQFDLEGIGDPPLGDPFLRLYNSGGQLVASNDDANGFDSQIVYASETGGTFYVAAGGVSSYVGQYRLSGAETPAPDVLDSIDWGTAWPDNHIKVYFARDGETFDAESSLGWTRYERQQAMAALQQYANVSGLTFEETNNAAKAEFKLITGSDDPSGNALGYFNPPEFGEEGVGKFYREGQGWDENRQGGLDQGGYGFITLLHEFGHGLGMAHPHDTGGTSTIMVGVTFQFDSYGLFGLNQGVFTTLSYNDGWPTGPDGQSVKLGWGWQGTPMALDIAMIQEKYGANTAFHAGDDVYALSDVKGRGTMYQCIWDAGGEDLISYSGARDSVIDLRAATIDYSPTGGGVVSHVSRIVGGFTIAQGVLIENALGGSGADQITGNAAANWLRGGAGADVLEGAGGADRLQGGGDADVFLYRTLETSRDTIQDLQDIDLISLRGIDARTDKAGDQKFRLVAAFDGHSGQATLDYNASKDRTTLSLDIDGDAAADMIVFIAGDHTGFTHFAL